MVLALLALATAPSEISVTVDGVVRTALVTAPTDAKSPRPLIFAFHGHGGSATNARRSYDFPKYWPDAITVYPHGVPTVTPNDPKGERRGWDMTRLPSNKDVKFFDALLAEIKTKYSVDTKRIYVMGHSNGGGFTYTLWTMRGETFAAFAPSASAGARRITAKPAFVVMGENDEVVDPKRQMDSINAIKMVNGITGEGKKESPNVTLYQGKADLATFIHSGDHRFVTESLPPMVEFFKRQRLP